MQIEGYSSENSEPVLKLYMGSSSIEFLIDTGFDGSLIVPTEIADGLSLRFEGFEEFHSVTGQIFVAIAYSIEIDWLGQKIRVPVAASYEVTEGLLGSHMLENCRLTIDYGRRTVTIAETR